MMLFLTVLVSTLIYHVDALVQFQPWLEPRSDLNSALTLAHTYAKVLNISDCWVCQSFPKTSTSWPLDAHPLLPSDLISISEQSNMGKIGSILTNLLINISIKEQSGWCTPIVGSGIKVGTLPVSLFRVFYTLLLRQRRDAKMGRWPKLLKLEKAEKQVIRGGKEYAFIMIFGDSNCTKPQGEAGAKCMIIEPLTMSNPYRCIFKVVDYPWESKFLYTHSVCHYRNCSHPHFNTWYLPVYNHTEISPQLALSVRFEGSSSWCIERNNTTNSKSKVHFQFSRCDKPFQITTNETLIAPNGTYFVCGNKAYPFLPKGWVGRCFLAYLLPAMRVVSEDYVKHHLIMTQTKRSISETEKWLGRFIPFLGVTDLQRELQALHEAFEATANTTLISIKDISDEIDAMRKVVLQNRMALDIMLASQGGTCKVIASECCSYIPDNTGKAVHNLANVLQNQITRLHEDNGLLSSSVDTWFKSILGPLWNLLKVPVVVAVSVVIIIMLLYIAARVLICIMGRLTVTRLSHNNRHTSPTDAGMQNDRNDLFF